ncbi:MAG TPA: type II toxin-antitoxin system RelE/ParE family toxin [Rhizomicrobium sp.]|jgi:toxin ParE1/3/4
MKLAVVVRRRAKADIRSTAQHIAQDSPAAAIAFEAEIIACFKRIGEHPALGAPSGTFRKLRVSERFQNWLVYYRQLDTGTVEIVRVLHGARDIGPFLGKPK